MDDSLYCGDEVTRVFKPTVRVVGDAAVFVCFYLVAVYKPFQWRSAVDNITMCFLWNACDADVFVDDKRVFCVFVFKLHGFCGEFVMFGFEFRK